MPTRADVEAATPKCPLELGNVGSGVRCGFPLRLNGPSDWSCPRHGFVSAGRVAPPVEVASSGPGRAA